MKSCRGCYWEIGVLGGCRQHLEMECEASDHQAYQLRERVNGFETVDEAQKFAEEVYGSDYRIERAPRGWSVIGLH